STARTMRRGTAATAAIKAYKSARLTRGAAYRPVRPGELRSTLAPVSTKPVLEAERRPAAPVEDIRSARPYLLSRRTLLALGRRLASIPAHVTPDVGGLLLG